MIQIATDVLRVQDEDGKPCELDMGVLEKRLGDSFRRLGFTDCWMAEDISLTVEEKVRSMDSSMMTLSEVDSLVVSLLKASGFPDVAMEYSRECGRDPFDDARKSMQKWTERGVFEGLRKNLPFTESQLQDIGGRCVRVLEACGLEVVSGRFVTDLALHLLLNNAVPRFGADKSGVKTEESDWRSGLTEGSLELLSSGVLRMLPVSGIFPRARLCVKLSMLSGAESVDLMSEIWLSHTFECLRANILEILGGFRKELGRLHPLQADSPSHLLIQTEGTVLEKIPEKGKNRRSRLFNTISGIMMERVVSHADFPVVVTCK